MVDTNLWTSVSRIYKGYFQIYDGTTAYKYDQPIEMKETIGSNYVTHYSTSGKKKLASIGHNSQYTITVHNTADLYDTSVTPTVTRSISYFIDKIIDNAIPDIEFEGVEETEATTNKFIRNRFKGGVVGVDRSRDNSTGTYTTTMVIEITEKVKVQRTTA